MINYSWISDNVEHYGTSTRPTADCIAAAVNALDAEAVGRGGYRYYAEETSSYWTVSAEDLASLGAALLAGHNLSECYSVWCAVATAAEDN